MRILEWVVCDRVDYEMLVCSEENVCCDRKIVAEKFMDFIN